MMTLRRFVHSGNGPRRKAALASSQFHERGATDPATRWRRTVLLSAAGIMACTLGAVAFLGLPRALAQTEPGTPPESGGYGYAGGATEASSEMGSYGYAGGASKAQPGDGGYGYRGDATGTDSSFGGYGGGAPSPRQELEAQLTSAMNRLRQAEDDAPKEAIKRELSNILESYFDKDMQRRLSEIALIEHRVKQLRDQCEQRQQSKPEILQLQWKVLENEAAGLGFFAPELPGAPMGSAGSGPGAGG